MLTESNFTKGFLIDDDLMAGVSESPEKPGTFLAFVLKHTTGETVGSNVFFNLSDALAAINQVQRNWTYERSGGCGGCKDGQCGKGQCGLGPCAKGAC